MRVSAPPAPPAAISSTADVPAAASAPVRELLTWVAARPRTHAETMAAWRSTCPRYTPWEDALDAALVRVVTGAGPGGEGDVVRLTPRGRALLGGA
jgi:hypothetical protein